MSDAERAIVNLRYALVECVEMMRTARPHIKVDPTDTGLMIYYDATIKIAERELRNTLSALSRDGAAAESWMQRML